MKGTILGVLLLVACSGAATQSSGSGNLVTSEQLVATNSGSLYDALEKLRPEWLTSRGPTSISDATPTVASVYMNGTMLGKVDYLREVRVVDVSEVRYWPAGQAATKFGMGHPRGVIELIRK
jgi:hypothetical protein